MCLHTETLFSFMLQRRRRLLFRLFIKCSFLSSFLNLHDMSGCIYTPRTIFSIKLFTSKKLYKFLAPLAFLFPLESQMSCLIKRIKSHGTTLVIWRSDSFFRHRVAFQLCFIELIQKHEMMRRGILSDVLRSVL